MSLSLTIPSGIGTQSPSLRQSSQTNDTLTCNYGGNMVIISTFFP
jgi:hypothetical protein